MYPEIWEILINQEQEKQKFMPYNNQGTSFWLENMNVDGTLASSLVNGEQGWFQKPPLIQAYK